MAHAGGRPLKFKTPEEMQAAIDAYFTSCDPHFEDRYVWVEGKKGEEGKYVTRKVWSHQQPYTMSGLALALDLSRQGLIDYEKRGKFLDTIKKARQRVEIYVETQMLAGQGVMAGVIFNAKNNFGWKDKSELELGGPNGGPIEVKAALDLLDNDLAHQARRALDGPTP